MAAGGSQYFKSPNSQSIEELANEVVTQNKGADMGTAQIRA